MCDARLQRQRRGMHRPAAAKSHQTASTTATITPFPVIRVRIELIEVICGR